MICGEKTTTQQAIDMDLLTEVSMAAVPELLRRKYVPADAAEGLNIQIRALSWGKHDDKW